MEEIIEQIKRNFDGEKRDKKEDKFFSQIASTEINKTLAKQAKNRKVFDRDVAKALGVSNV